jgi:hypothetical protein
MFESLIQVLHQLALNALSLALTLLSGGLPASDPAHTPPEPTEQHGALLLDERARYAESTCGLRGAQLLRIDFDGQA